MGLAMGIAISGGGIGGLFLAPVMQAILDTLGWQWAWRIGGLIAGIGGGGAGFLIKARLPIPKRKAGIMAQFDFYRFKDFTFVRLYFSIMFVSLSFFVPYSYSDCRRDRGRRNRRDAVSRLCVVFASSRRVY